MRFNPFDKNIKELLAPDLDVLRDIAEGWYVEYKRSKIERRKLAKQLASFANQYGGWIFWGVVENPETRTAASFPGLKMEEILGLEEALRDASRQSVNPEVFFETSRIEGPCDKISLPEDRWILILRIPPGHNPPYITTDGRIYRRVSDASDPKPETDRYIIERLLERGRKSKESLMNVLSTRPKLSVAENEVPYVHLNVFVDPVGEKDYWYDGTFEDFVEVMKMPPVPFDAFYPTSSGFFANQVAGNVSSWRTMSWEFRRNFHSVISIPLNVIKEPLSGVCDTREKIDFVGWLLDKKLTDRLLDIELLPFLVVHLLSDYYKFVRKSGIDSPIALGIQIDNVWRKIPFVAMNEVMDHFRENGVPLIQEECLRIPFPFKGYEHFILTADDETKKTPLLGPCLDVLCKVYEALGIPPSVLSRCLRDLVSPRP